MPNVPLFQTERRLVTVRRTLAAGHTVELAYDRTDPRERISFIHSIRPARGPRWRFFTEVGEDLDVHDLFFEHRIEYLFTPSGNIRASLQARVVNKAWSVMFVLTVSELFAAMDRGIRRISHTSVSPWNGGVQGRVFSDANVNGRWDTGEEGVADVSVSNAFGRVATDDEGYFILPGDRRMPRDRVWLDAETVPATHSVLHGIQTAHTTPNALTRIDLGIAPRTTPWAMCMAQRPTARKPRSAALRSCCSARRTTCAWATPSRRRMAVTISETSSGRVSSTRQHGLAAQRIRLEDASKPLTVIPTVDVEEYKPEPFLASLKPR